MWAGFLQNAVYTHGIMRLTQIAKAVIIIVEIIPGMIPEKNMSEKNEKDCKKAVAIPVSV